MNWDNLKDAVSSVIKNNGNKEISGQILQDVINENLIPHLGRSTFMGFAEPYTNPPFFEGEVFYLTSSEGVYSNFGGITVNSDELVALRYTDGEWVKHSISLPEGPKGEAGGVQGIERVNFFFFVTLSEGDSLLPYYRINNSPQNLKILAGQIPSFVFLFKDDSLFETVGTVPKLNIYTLNGEQQGKLGLGGDRVLKPSDLQIRYERSATSDEIEQDPDTQTISFPNITGDVHDWLNQQDPAIEMQQTSEGLVIFKGHISGDDKSFLFVGSRDKYGVNESQSVANDFEPLKQSAPPDQNIDDSFDLNSTNPLQNKVISLWRDNVNNEIDSKLSGYYTTQTFTYELGSPQEFITSERFDSDTIEIFSNGILLINPAQYNLYPSLRKVKILDTLENNEIITIKHQKL